MVWPGFSTQLVQWYYGYRKPASSDEGDGAKAPKPTIRERACATRLSVRSACKSIPHHPSSLDHGGDRRGSLPRSACKCLGALAFSPLGLPRVHWAFGLLSRALAQCQCHLCTSIMQSHGSVSVFGQALPLFGPSKRVRR